MWAARSDKRLSARDPHSASAMGPEHPETEAATARVGAISARCIVCDAEVAELVCGHNEINRHRRYLERFRRRRLLDAGMGRGAERLAVRTAFRPGRATAIVSCVSCGLVFHRPKPAARTLAAADAGDAYGRERLDTLFASQVELVAPRVERLRSLMGDPLSRPVVVEVGSFVGGFLAAAEAAGWTAVGIESGAEVVAFCREKQLRVRLGTAVDVPLQSACADVVAIWNTFGRLADPRPTLAAARRWLRPGGLLALRVPNGFAFRTAIGWLRALPRALQPPLMAAMAWNSLLAFPYPHGYSPETLTHLAGEFGWRPLAIDADTLPRGAGDQTSRWGAWEERILNAAWRALAARNASLAPWFDAYYI